jgi:hypothetical protein
MHFCIHVIHMAQMQTCYYQQVTNAREKKNIYGLTATIFNFIYVYVISQSLGCKNTIYELAI